MKYSVLDKKNIDNVYTSAHTTRNDFFLILYFVFLYNMLDSVS